MGGACQGRTRVSGMLSQRGAVLCLCGWVDFPTSQMLLVIFAMFLISFVGSHTVNSY